MLNGEHTHGGNGVICACLWCGDLLAAEPAVIGRWRPDPTNHPTVWLEVVKLEQDRLGGLGTPYAFANVVAACGPCNRRRTYEQFTIPDGCAFGPEEQTA